MTKQEFLALPRAQSARESLLSEHVEKNKAGQNARLSCLPIPVAIPLPALRFRLLGA
jgi:hypothetical protein